MYTVQACVQAKLKVRWKSNRMAGGNEEQRCSGNIRQLWTRLNDDLCQQTHFRAKQESLLAWSPVSPPMSRLLYIQNTRFDGKSLAVHKALANG